MSDKQENRGPVDLIYFKKEALVSEINKKNDELFKMRIDYENRLDLVKIETMVECYAEQGNKYEGWDIDEIADDIKRIYREIMGWEDINDDYLLDLMKRVSSCYENCNNCKKLFWDGDKQEYCEDCYNSDEDDD
jgi:hypothetical protein